MQPNYLNLTHALVKTEDAEVASLDNQSPNRDQRRKAFVRSVQETDSFRYTSRRKVSAAKIANFDRSGEPVLQCGGDRLPSERPVPDEQNRRNAEEDGDESPHDQAPARKG